MGGPEPRRLSLAVSTPPVDHPLLGAFLISLYVDSPCDQCRAGRAGCAHTPTYRICNSTGTPHQRPGRSNAGPYCHVRAPLPLNVHNQYNRTQHTSHVIPLRHVEGSRLSERTPGVKIRGGWYSAECLLTQYWFNRQYLEVLYRRRLLMLPWHVQADELHASLTSGVRGRLVLLWSVPCHRDTRVYTAWSASTSQPISWSSAQAL